MEQNINPVASLLQQALGLVSSNMSIPVVIDYNAITLAVFKALNEERKKIQPRVLITQKDAMDTYGQSVIKSLVKRGFLQQYKFDVKEMVDREGNLIKKTKGVIYYRVEEIERGVEEGNVLKGTRRGKI